MIQYSRIFQIKLIMRFQFRNDSGNSLVRLLFNDCFFYLALWQIFYQHGFQFFRNDRFGEKIIKSFRQIHFLCTCYRICGKSNNRSARAQILIQFLHFVECLHTVHFRHHMIQKNDVVFFDAHQSQTLYACGAFINLKPRFLKKINKYFSIHGIVIYNQYICIRCSKGSAVFIILCLFKDSFFQIANRFRICDFLLQIKGKCGPLPIDAFHLQFASH